MFEAFFKNSTSLKKFWYSPLLFLPGTEIKRKLRQALTHHRVTRTPFLSWVGKKGGDPFFFDVKLIKTSLTVDAYQPSWKKIPVEIWLSNEKGKNITDSFFDSSQFHFLARLWYDNLEEIFRFISLEIITDLEIRKSVGINLFNTRIIDRYLRIL